MDRPWSKPYYRISHAQRGPYQLTVREWDTFVEAYVIAPGTFTRLTEMYFGKDEVKAAKQALENYVATLIPSGGH